MNPSTHESIATTTRTPEEVTAATTTMKTTTTTSTTNTMTRTMTLDHTMCDTFCPDPYNTARQSYPTRFFNALGVDDKPFVAQPVMGIAQDVLFATKK